MLMKRINIFLLVLFMALFASAQNSVLGIGDTCNIYNSKKLTKGLFESLGDSVVFKLLDIYQYHDSPYYFNIPFTCEINSRGRIHSISLINRGKIANKVISQKELLKLKKYLNQKKTCFKVCYIYDPYDKENILSLEDLNNKFKRNKYINIIVYFPSLLLRDYKGDSRSLNEKFLYLKSLIIKGNNDFLDSMTTD